MTLYVSDGCPKCRIAEKVAKEDVVIQAAEDNIDKFESHNVSTVPVLELDDGTWVTDFTNIMGFLKGDK